MIKAVIFDMDGLMADTESRHKLAFRRFLEAYGHSFPESYFARFVGVNVRDNVKVLKREFNLPGSVDELLAEREAIYLDLLRSSPPEPAPGLKDIISFSLDRGLYLAVASGSPVDQINMILGNLLVHMGFNGTQEGIFKAIVSATTVKRPKPAPDVYLAVTGKLGVEPADCLAFEDSEPGVKAAVSAGIVCVACPNQYTKGSDFSQAQYVVDSLEEGMSILEKLCGVEQGAEKRG